jgi:hypothetical protein
MATKSPAKTLSPQAQKLLLQEAEDPVTAPERLEELIVDRRLFAPNLRGLRLKIQEAIWSNPSCPTDILRGSLLSGNIEAWSNPMAPLLVLTWTPSPDDEDATIEDGARTATRFLLRGTHRGESKTTTDDVKKLIAFKIIEWWNKANDSNMLMYLGEWAMAKGPKSKEYKDAMRIGILCARNIPALSSKDAQAIDLIEEWISNGKDVRKNALKLANSPTVKSIIKSAMDDEFNPGVAMQLAAQEIADRGGGEKAFQEYLGRMANKIRQEIPVPPVVA